ncbi:hypothetical protein Pan241w_11360 [Gimesia alba]|uniref:Terminase-like family protein n=1 Tax=Gimesia alba TaxID=2527973 RepID=A0A517RB10_9PLAN|nr:hypothetical protein Pan241w_11360 [Gimesia alba]
MAAAEQELAQRSLYHFTKQAWHILEPDAPFVDNWHIKAIAEHLEAIVNPVNDDTLGLRDFLIKKLLINVPPGAMKSILVNVMFPAWTWGPNNKPSKRFFYASYDQALSMRDSVKCRDLIRSDWYQKRWGKIFSLKYGQDQKKKFENNKKGWRMATSVGGTGTGEHPDVIVVDDPHNALQAESENERKTAVEWWSGTMATRGVSRQSSRVMIMQRLHDQDLSGHVLTKEKGWLHICLPMRFEFDRMKTTPLGFNDPRTEVGELLWPALFNEQAVDDLENTLRAVSEASIAGQLQQRPPEKFDGAEWPAGYFKEGIWFSEWPDPKDIILKVVTLDPSKGATEKSDYQAYIKLAVAKNGTCYVECDMEREDIARMVMRCFETYVSFGPDHFAIEENFFEGMLSGAVKAQSQAAGFMIPVIGITNRLNKIQRIRQLTTYLANGEIRFKAGHIGTALLVNQLKAFPGGTHDDGPDALEMAMRTVRELLLGE